MPWGVRGFVPLCFVCLFSWSCTHRVVFCVQAVAIMAGGIEHEEEAMSVFKALLELQLTIQLNSVRQCVVWCHAHRAF